MDVTTLTEPEILELVEATQTVRSMADAACVQAAGALDVTKAWAPEGAKSPTAWMAWRCRIPMARAATALRCARELRRMPIVETALVAGSITTDHVKLLADARQCAPEAFEADEERLAVAAGASPFARFQTAIAYWKYVHASDQVEADAASAAERREAHVSTTFKGTVVLDALLDPIGGAIVVEEIERLEQQLFEHDWAEARQRLGDAATASDLARTPRQRRADAFVLMAQRSAAAPADATPARPLLQVLVGEASLERICELASGQVVTPGSLVPLLAWADVQRIVFDGPSRVIDVGRRRRLFTGATRTAIQVRDRECTHPSCDVPAIRCEIDHIIPFSSGGLTVQSNGCCRCRFHNQLKGAERPPP